MTDAEMAGGAPGGLTDEEMAAGAPAPTEAPGNPVANMGRRLFGVDPRARFSLKNLVDNGPEQQGDPGREAMAKEQQLKAIPADVRSPEGSDYLKERQRDSNNPIAHDWGAQAIIGGLLGGAAGRLVAPAAEAIAGAGAPVLTGATEGAVASKAQGGDAAGGGVIGAGLGMLGPLGTAVMNSKGGRARGFLEEHGAEVSPFTAGRGKPFDEMVTAGTTDADIGKQASASAEKGLGMLAEKRRGELRPVGKLYDTIDNSPAGRAPRDVTDLVTHVQDALGEIDIASATEAELRTALAKVEGKQAPGFNPDTDNYQLSEADLNKLRRKVDRGARTGASTDEKLSPLKGVADEARDMVDQGPYKPVNDMYAAASTKYRDSRKLLGINERPKTPQETQAAVEKVTNLITRRNQNTVTAGKAEAGTQGNLAAFEQKHPDIGDELAKPAMLRSKADISFHVLPQRHGGLIDRTGNMLGSAATVEGLMHMIGHGHVTGAKLGLGIGAGLTLQNLPAIQARLLYPGAKLAAGGGAAKLTPLFAAARAAQERQ